MKTRCTQRNTWMAMLAGAALALGTSTAGAQEASNTSSNSAKAGTAKTKLAAGEEKAGWKLLFDGKTLNGWKAFKKDAGAPTGWVVENGILTTPGGKGDIVTTGQYENFELDLEWKIAPKGNSGILFRVVDDGRHERTYETGPEYQLIDDQNYPAELKEVQKTAANYDLEPATKGASKPAGEWNRTRLVVKEGRVQHWLNGEKVVEYEIGSDAWKKQVQGSKFAPMPGYAKTAKGRIAFQDHGDRVWFRNVKIKEL
jgi:hypothetical protein